MFRVFARALRLPDLRRRADVGDRAAVLTLFARFADELFSGLLIVLMPTIRTRLRLDVQQVGWCFQLLSTVAAVVEPLSGAAIDLFRRRPLLVCGAAGWGAALLLAGGATGYGWLLAAFALVGLASGPLAQTADVVLVEAHPQTVERVASRSTLLDSVGALIAPVAISVAAWSGLDERLLLAAAGSGALGYAVMLAGTVLPQPPRRPEGVSVVTLGVRNLGAVLRDRRARRWLGALLLFELLEPLELFEPVWLASSAGASQGGVGLHQGLQLAVTFATLAVLDRWLAHHDSEPVLIAASAASLVFVPAWLLVPTLWAKYVLVVPRSIAMAPLWPILRSRALAALPGKGGAAAGVTALLGLLPINAAVGWAAARIGLTRALLVVTLAGLGGLLGVLLRTAPDRQQTTGESTLG